MEAKLRQMEQSSSAVPLPPPHPSLPSKPLGAALAATLASSGNSVQRVNVKKSSVLPSLPLPQPAPAASRAPPIPQANTTSASFAPLSRKAASSLTGVKIRKHKEGS